MSVHDLEQGFDLDRDIGIKFGDTYRRAHMPVCRPEYLDHEVGKTVQNLRRSIEARRAVDETDSLDDTRHTVKRA